MKSKFPMPPKRQNQGKRAIKKNLTALQQASEQQQEYIQLLKQNIDAINDAHNLHIAALSNFLGHDMKNCIQNMDAILSTYRANEITDEHLVSLRTQLDVIRETMANFSKLIPHGKNSIFNVNKLIGGTEALTRELLAENKVHFNKQLLQEIDLHVNYPFHSLLQIFVNLIINACNNLKNTIDAHILFKIDIDQKEKNLFFSIYDNGSTISEIDTNKIFEYGYSTTGGSGIGLYHAQYICELLHGNIQCIASNKPEFSKRFLITLPFKGLDDE
ncbi:ATP-binding protein [Neisseria sp.]|uniref:ATP-binding protein n=1 Tax=Neisseria sp. TaxID=192066 RepID=UPI0035A017F0